MVLGLPLFALVALVVVTAGVVPRGCGDGAPGTVLGALGAGPSNEDDRPRLHNLVDGLCATMGLDRPAIAVVVSGVPNALALGRDPKSATLVVTSGLEQALTLVELEGVLAHELVHIKRNDTVLSAVAVLVAVPVGRCPGYLGRASRPSTGWSVGAASSPPTSAPPWSCAIRPASARRSAPWWRSR